MYSKSMSYFIFIFVVLGLGTISDSWAHPPEKDPDVYGPRIRCALIELDKVTGFSAVLNDAEQRCENFVRFTPSAGRCVGDNTRSEYALEFLRPEDDINEIVISYLVGDRMGRMISQSRSVVQLVVQLVKANRALRRDTLIDSPQSRRVQQNDLLRQMENLLNPQPFQVLRFPDAFEVADDIGIQFPFLRPCAFFKAIGDAFFDRMKYRGSESTVASRTGMKSRSVVDMSTCAVLALPCYNLASQYGGHAQPRACAVYRFLKTALSERAKQVDTEVAAYYKTVVNPRLAKMKLILNNHELWNGTISDHWTSLEFRLERKEEVTTQTQ